MERPNNVSELRSFLGMITYCGRFIKNLATLTEPLRHAIKQKRWTWSKECEATFQKIKDSLSNETTYNYFD